MTSEKIKPCPFCKSSGDKLYALDGDYPRAICFVRCTSCGAAGPAIYTNHKFKKKPKNPKRLMEFMNEANRAKTESIDAWNMASLWIKENV